MGRYGRPKLPEAERRTALTLNVRFNKQEKEIVERKAHDAGVTVTEWARLAALEQRPPERRVIPEINRETWLELARLTMTLNGMKCQFQPSVESSLRKAIDAVQVQLGEIRNRLVGNE
jgi:hypothetical protein